MRIMKKSIFLLIAGMLLAVTSCEKKPAVEENDPQLDVDQTALSFTKEGGFREVVITSDQEWEITIEDTEWLSSSVPKGEGNATVKFTATPHDTPEERPNVITVKSATITREITVTQTAAEPRLEIDKQAISTNYTGTSEVIKITSNTDWKVVIGEDDAKWVAVDAEKGTGDGEVTVTIPPYYGEQDRTATIAVETDGIRREIEISQTFPRTVGLWILSEGSPSKPASDLAYYDFVNDELKTKFYSGKHGEPLGQLANYMAVYGSKLYVTVAGPPDASASSVKVLDSKTGDLLKVIDMKSSHGEGDVSRQMAFHDGKVYVTSYFSGGKGEPGDIYSYYGGVVKIDTASLAIEASTRVGDKPEGIAYLNGKLYVCNSETGEGQTVSVVDVNTFQQERTITVPQNPVYIKAAPNGDLYLSTLEIYTGANKGPSGFHQIDPETYQVRTFEGARASRFGITEDYVYTGEFSYNTYADTANRIDRKTGAVTPIDLAHPYFMIYSFDTNPVNGDIYIGGQGQDVIIMNKNGEKVKSLQVGVGFVIQFVPVFE